MLQVNWCGHVLGLREMLQSRNRCEPQREQELKSHVQKKLPLVQAVAAHLPSNMDHHKQTALEHPGSQRVPSPNMVSVLTVQHS